jgi:superfamily II DNA helicase RecQ
VVQGFARFLGSNQSDAEAREVLAMLRSQHPNPLRLLYVTPEKIAASNYFVESLELCHHAGRLKR